MSERTVGVVACLGLLMMSLGAACRPRGAIEIAPPDAPPGATAVVRVPRLAPGTKVDAVEITVGGRPATVLRIDPRAGIEILVPERAPGPAEVAVRIAGREAGRAPFTVAPSPARQLVLTMTGERIELLASRGASGLGRPSRELPARRGLAYDVVTRDGRLVATGVLPHPLADRNEIFEPDGTMHGAPAPASATFTLRIPAVPAGSVVRFYEFEPDTMMDTADGRAARRLISEIAVGGGA